MPPDTPTATPPGSAARLAVDVRRFHWIRPLAGEYAFNFEGLAPFYAGDPRSAQAWRDVYERVTRHPRERETLAACLAAQQARRGAPPAARASAERLGEARTAAVVTGQQAGAFGGPLFTLLKAITAIQLARRAEADLGVPVVPVFWVDAEDHDWDEVATGTILDTDLQPRTFEVPSPPGAGELPVAALRLDERIAEQLAALERALGPTEFTGWVLARLKDAYAAGIGMAEAFARWLDALLGPQGLVVCDSSDPGLKPLSAEIFSREVISPGRTSTLASRAGDELAALGHAPQVVPQPGSLALLWQDGARRPIQRQDDQLSVDGRDYSAAALAEEARTHPEHFSPNVLLRPIVQDTLFPTLCYVAGPSELAYLGQLRAVYEHFGVPMPLIHPRASATIVDSAAARFLLKYEIPLEELQPQDESALNRLLASQLPPVVDSAFQAAEGAVREGMRHVVDVVPLVDPTLAGAARTTVGKLEHELRTLHGKVIQAAKKRDETLRRQFRRAQMQAFPQGQPQERALAGLFFLNLYGPALLDRLLEELPLEPGQHWVITV